MNIRIWSLGLITIGFFSLIFLFPPIPQDQSYHQFIDTREFIFIPNFFNVFSNLPFLLIGCLFFFHKKNKKDRILVHEELWFKRSFFGGLILLSLGSTYYHLFPNNNSLMWDRIPITIVLMSLTAWIVADRIQILMGMICLPSLLIAGVGSVIYWHITEQQGSGDLRLYAFFTLFPFILIFLIFILFPNKNKESRSFFVSGGYYLLAKVFEYFDKEVFMLTGAVISGHTLKHLTASIAVYILIGKWTRKPPEVLRV